MKKDSDEIRDYIRRNRENFDRISDAIWEFAEFRFQEYRSVELLMQQLRNENFVISENLAGIKTAFMAEWGNRGPVIGILGEYDALPGLSQEADAVVRKPLANQDYGHGCGHHLLGSAAAEAACAVKRYLEEQDIPGRIRFYGCPAEEGAAAKGIMLAKGCFDDLDCCISWHPGTRKSIGGSTLANIRVYYTFYGVSAHAAVSPHMGRSALDAVELMDVGCNYLREHIIPGAKLHYAITNAGGNMPNIVPAEAEVCYTIRAPKTADLMEIYERVTDVAKGAALMTGTSMKKRPVSYYADFLDNRTLNQLTAECMDEIMDETYSTEEIAFAQKFIPVIPAESLREEEADCRRYGESRSPEYVNSPVSLYRLPIGMPKTPSTDYGNVSWVIPSAVFDVPCFARGTVLHNWQAVAQGKSCLAHHGRDNAAAVMALTALRLFRNPETIIRAKQDLEFMKNGESYHNILDLRGEADPEE